MKIPFEKIYDFYEKYQQVPLDDKKWLEYHRHLLEMFEIMHQFTPEDIEKLTKEELEKLPIGWLYDWNKVTGGFEDPDKILELYQKYNIKPLNSEECLKKFGEKK